MTSWRRATRPSGCKLPAAARAAIAAATQARATGAAAPWSLVSLRRERTWALGTVTPVDLDQPAEAHEESRLNAGNLISVLLVETAAGWEAALAGDDRVYALLDRVPEAALAAEARAALFPRKGDILASVYSGYKIFWPAGSAWAVTQGWHDGYTWGGRFPAYTSLDFDIIGSANSDILAGAPGTVPTNSTHNLCFSVLCCPYCPGCLADQGHYKAIQVRIPVPRPPLRIKANDR